MKKILKLAYEGKDFGYMRIAKNGTFYGDGSESDAVEFEQVKYKNMDGAYYYKISGTKGYLDFSATSSALFSDTPWLSVESSSICAWKMIDNELHAILGSKDTTKALSRSAKDEESSILFANISFDGHHCKVEILDSTNKSNNLKKEVLAHAID
jgi:hypothetical protein